MFTYLLNPNYPKGLIILPVWTGERWKNFSNMNKFNQWPSHLFGPGSALVIITKQK